MKINVKKLSSNQWDKVIKVMASQACFLAKLLSGEMPHDIEDVFRTAGVFLFPSSAKDFTAECSCPDWANPCKHIAAVYYIIGEVFDRNPFLIFHLRGLKKDELLKALKKESGILTEETQRESTGEKEEEKEELVTPLSSNPLNFWKLKKPIDYQLSLKRPPLNAAILHRLSVPQFWTGTTKDFYKIMEKVYQEVTESALKLAFLSRGNSVDT